MTEYESLVESLRIAYGDEFSKMATIIKGDENTPLYHISFDNKIRSFVPRFSTKLVHGESRAIPRTSTSSSILGCMLGFGDIGRGYLNNAFDSKNDNTIFIYKMDYDLAVKPSKDLVPDVDYTDEHWLIASSVRTREYTGSIIGKGFLSNIGIDLLRNGSIYNYTWYFILDNKTKFIKGLDLEPGYYRINLLDIGGYDFIPKVGDNIKVEKITKDEFLFHEGRRIDSIVNKRLY